MTESKPTARGRLAPAGLLFLAITSVGWGFNWPVTKVLLAEWPPLTLRGGTGVIGALLLAMFAVARRQSLVVPAEQWPRLIVAAFLNVTIWMALMGVALLWLRASEGALIAYTMPVWASALAWPVLGERPTLLRLLSLAMALAGLGAVMGSNGVEASVEKLPGALLALVSAIGLALGTVLTKRLPIKLPAVPVAAWQIGIGCLPVALLGLAIETVHVETITPLGWLLLSYTVVMQFCVGYLSWFAALARLPASVAAIGSMAVPVIGVMASAVALNEPLGPGQIAALLLTLAAVALATRS